MIKSRRVHGKVQDPPVNSFPFLWRDGNIVWLRNGPGHRGESRDICISGERWFNVGNITITLTLDQEAWSKRLQPGEVVELSNE